MESIDLSHWNTVEHLGTKQLVALAVGIDPYSEQLPTATQNSKQKLLLSHLNDAYLRAVGWAFEAAQRISADDDALAAIRQYPLPPGIPADGSSPAPGKWPSLPSHAGKTGLLPTQELIMAFEGAFWDAYIPETLERIHQCGENLPYDALFERDAIFDWLNFLGWFSDYEFAPWRNKKVGNEATIASGEFTHPRTERHYLSLIAAMAIDKYGYEPGAARSGVPGDLSVLLRAKGVSLTDEVIRRYLKDGAGHLNAQNRR